MTTLVVTTEMVLVDTRLTWAATYNIRTKIHQYKGLIYTACGVVGGGQVQVYRFIDELLDESKPWPTIVKDDVDASYVLVITEDIPHRHLSKGDVICIDIDAGAVSHDTYFNQHELTAPGVSPHMTTYVDGSGGRLYQTFLTTHPDPIAAFELAVEHDPYSGFPYQYIDRRTCTVQDGFRLSNGQRSFAHIQTVAGKAVNLDESFKPCKGE